MDSTSDLPFVPLSTPSTVSVAAYFIVGHQLLRLSLGAKPSPTAAAS